MTEGSKKYSINPNFCRDLYKTFQISLFWGLYGAACYLAYCIFVTGSVGSLSCSAITSVCADQNGTETLLGKCGFNSTEVEKIYTACTTLPCTIMDSSDRSVMGVSLTCSTFIIQMKWTFFFMVVLALVPPTCLIGLFFLNAITSLIKKTGPEKTASHLSALFKKYVQTPVQIRDKTSDYEMVTIPMPAMDPK